MSEANVSAGNWKPANLEKKTYKKTSNDKSYTLVYRYVDFATAITNLPARNAYCPYDEDMKLTDSTVDESEAGTVLVTLNYYKSYGGGRVPRRIDKEDEYTVSGNSVENPISAHPDFLVCWGYYLATGKVTDDNGTVYAKATEAYSGWDSQGCDDNDEIDLSTPTPNYRWIQSPSELPNDKWEILTKRKVSTDTYKVGSVTVVHKKWYDDDVSNQLGNCCANAGSLEVPAKTFGLPDSIDNWFLESVDCQPEDSMWCVTKYYLYAQKIETILYLDD